ncbi:MAG TPA: DUF5696 domain-containing protein [Verrucomicrobiae bacterium]
MTQIDLTRSPRSSPLCWTLLGLAACLLCASSTAGENTTARIETSRLRFTVRPDESFELWDKKAQIAWRADAAPKRMGQVTLNAAGRRRQVDLTGGRYETGGNELLATFHPVSEQPDVALQVRVKALPDASVLEVDYRAAESLNVESISLLDSLLGVTDTAGGYVTVPVREGLLIPADSGLAFEHRFDTSAYEGCHMQMIGAVRSGAAILVTWPDPYTAVLVRSVTNSPGASGRQQVTASLALRKSASSFRLQVLGRGDYVSIAKAYRSVAEARGLLVPWSQKLKQNPERAKLFGAANIKLWSALDRRMNEDSTKEESVRLNWTFAEAAQVAEHLKRDLQLEKVLFTVGGWIHRGYDNQHPDILPAAPECGGDLALADCARRVMDLGYLFCLHDNYQDIYRDSPSWNERYVMKTADGKLTRGGHWAGGLAYLTCSKMALELAQRPQNLRAVQQLCHANSYFIDTTYASGLQECFDPNHPLTRADDIKWKQALSDYAREVFGTFGSECGREWAIPHSDFFEGLTGVSGTYYADASLTGKLGATVIPLFELVYRDCIAMYGKYEYEPSRSADYVLHHISIGRPLNYHSIPPHLYWQQTTPGEGALPVRPAVAGLRQTAPREFAVSYRWTRETPPGPKPDAVTNDWRVFVHFTDRSGNIKFQNDYQPTPSVANWQPGETRQGPFTVTIPEGLAGSFNVRMGLFREDNGQRALLPGRDNGQRSYLVGRINVAQDQIEFQPVGAPAQPSSPAAPFVRADNGWAEGLHPTDIFIKNTCEVLSPLNELTAQLQMTRHEFLTPDRKVQRTVFGAGSRAVEVVANAGAARFTYDSKSGGKVDLPPFGFVVDSPGFVAFYASSWNGLSYEEPSMFALRSVDQRPLSRANGVRVYHAFGPERVRLNGEVRAVRTGTVVER